MHEILTSLLKMIDQLRSSLSKISLISLRELFEQLPRNLYDLDTEPAFQSLIKKSIDSNVFMAEEAEKTLVALCRHVNESKVTALLITASSNRAQPMRI